MNPEFPADPKAVKKVETAITKEARADEKDYQRAVKELKQSEKSEAKTVKAAHGADKNLKKMEQKEYDTVKSLQKATHLHDRAVTNLHTAQSDVQIQKQQAQKIKRDTETLRVRVDEHFKSKQIREEERGRKLAILHSPVRSTGVETE